MATLTRVQAKITGTVLTATAATAGPDKVEPGDSGGSVYVLVHNGSGAGITVSIDDPNLAKYGQTIPDVTSVSIPAAGYGVLGPIQSDLKQVSDGLVNLTASSATSVNFFAFRG
jgi:hypothetical protein